MTDNGKHDLGHAEEQRYEPPALRVVGTVYALTQENGGNECFFHKTIGPPDFVNFIPIARCS